jgi:hypothetical protein
MGIIREVKQLFETTDQREARLLQEHRARITDEVRKAASEGWVTIADCSRVAGIPALEKDAYDGPSVENMVNRGQIQSRRILTNFGDVILVRSDVGEKIANQRTLRSTVRMNENRVMEAVTLNPEPARPKMVETDPQVLIKEDATGWKPWNLFPKD